MESLKLDPYEQQLYSVFSSYDHEKLGSLDKSGLTELCQTLQLEEQSGELIRNLIEEPKHLRATFIEFKEALLNLLGNMQNQKSDNTKKNVDNSPEREVSPKFIYGSKKYGRRSRPRIDISKELEENDEINKSPTNFSIQRSNSQTEVSHSKKRKTNYKLQRCISLPGYKNNVDGSFIASNLNTDTEFICTEEMLREAWKKLGVGKDGYLNKQELILVCEAIGLHKLADGVLRQLSDKFTKDINYRISFQELLQALQDDETWFALLDNSSVTHIEDTISSDYIKDDITSDSRTFQYISLGPNSNGYISVENIIEMWESVGITSPKELIHELGFNSREINVVELAIVLEKEIRGMSETTRLEIQNPHVSLLQANLTLYQSEIRCLKTILEQICAEREKFKCDLYEANNRAALLAQEVDDNHVRMERNSQNQIKLLEQRHADILKNITQQYANDKEQLSSINNDLEKKLHTLEQEVQKLKDELNIAHEYTMSLEKENQVMSIKINDLEQVKEIITNQLNCLKAEKQKYTELEHEQIETLLEKLSNLQLENARLRDKNDEMVAEIESLTVQVASLRSKVGNETALNFNMLTENIDENISHACEGVGLGAKRRSEHSPTKDDILFGTDGTSPRLGKFLKFQGNVVDQDVECNKSNGDQIATDSIQESLLNTSDDGNTQRLQSKIAYLEQLLAQHSIPMSGYNLSMEMPNGINLKNSNKNLADIFKNFLEIRNMININGLNCDTIKALGDKVETVLSSMEVSNDVSFAALHTDNYTNPLEDLMKKYENENKELSAKCNELENCIDLLRNEYEKCEDYWQSKLDEERQIFEQEQSQSNEKFADLIAKMTEYEEQFANQDVIDNRLPPIEETYNLEKQFTDLEQEFEDYKIHSNNELVKRDEEILILKQKLTELALCNTKKIEVATQASNDNFQSKLSKLSSGLIEQTSLAGEDAIPPMWSCPSQLQSDYPNTACSWSNQDSSNNDTRSDSLLHHNKPASSSASSTLEKNATPCRPKRTRKHERYNGIYKKNTQEKGVKKADDTTKQEQVVMLSLPAVHNLNGRLHHLEQRCRQLQLILKHQHFFTEQSIAQFRQIKGEKTELQCALRGHQEKLDQQVRICAEQLDRLARSDMLVKELYVENSYLIAKVQRLEQQCHFLAQSNSNSYSV